MSAPGVPRPSESALLQRPALLALTVVQMAAGVAVLTWTYAFAARATSDTANLHTLLFWLGLLLFSIPLVLWLIRPDLGQGERMLLLIALAVFDYLPKYLRDPSGPLYHDELAHWRQAELLRVTGSMYQPNPTVEIIQFFPGLHVATVALSDMSGLSIWAVATILLVIVHTLALLGIYFLAVTLTRSPLAGGIAALIYSLNPSFMFFDTQYAYESLAIVLLIWALVALACMQDNTRTLRERVGWWIGGVFIAGALVVTHHLSSYILLLMLSCCAAASVAVAKRRASERFNALLAVGYLAAIASMAFIWLVAVASSTVAYLAPNVTRGVVEVLSMIRHEQSSNHELFAGSVAPLYARLCSFASPAIAGLGTLGGLRLLRLRPGTRSVMIGLALFGLLYFPSVVFILTPNGNEGARRSWAFTYIGIAVLVSPFVMGLIQRAQRSSRPWLTPLLATCFTIMLIGNITMGSNEYYMFPGPYIYGSDTRSLTAESLGAAKWLRTTDGSGLNVVTDRANGLALSSTGLEWSSRTSSGFPVYELYFSTTLPSTYLIHELEYSNYTYMLTDKQMTRYLPKVGSYFEPDEPPSVQRTTPPPPAAIEKFNMLPWTIKIFQSDNLSIYRYDFGALSLTWRRR